MVCRPGRGWAVGVGAGRVPHDRFDNQPKRGLGAPLALVEPVPAVDTAVAGAGFAAGVAGAFDQFAGDVDAVDADGGGADEAELLGLGLAGDQGLGDAYRYPGGVQRGTGPLDRLQQGLVGGAAAGAGVQVQEEELDLQLPGRQGGGRQDHAGSPEVGFAVTDTDEPDRNGRRVLVEAVSHQTDRSLDPLHATAKPTRRGGLRPLRVGLVSKGKPDRFPARRRGTAAHRRSPCPG
jgi:hypothetical protein